MRRAWNFSAGPAVIPAEVLMQAANEMLDWKGSGMSVMELSHRGREFGSIIRRAEVDLRELLGVPDDYAVLFMQGGAIAENAIVPLNLLGKNRRADFVETGSWSMRSIAEAQRYGDVRVVATSRDERAPHGKYTRIPAVSEWHMRPDTAYLHLCGNETIDGVEYFAWPNLDAFGAGDVPLVVDMSSHILSRPIDVTRFGLIYCGAQKNLGPAGLTLVIVRRDLLDQAHPLCPAAFRYKAVARSGSMFNTPPTYAIYVAGLVLQWLKRRGGLVEMERRNIAKAKLLYDAIDNSGLYVNYVQHSVRSRMNVPFFLRDQSLNEAFLEGARVHGLLQLRGHKSVGGMRASLYNAMPIEGVHALVDYLREFEKTRA